jgi:hypothetical protein
MASDNTPYPDHKASSMTVAELVSYTKKELDADATERQAKVTAVGALGDLHAQTGATLDLSHRNIHALPVEVIALIKDKVERYEATVPSVWMEGRGLMRITVVWRCRIIRKSQSRARLCSATG